MGREITALSDRDFTRSKYHVWLGSERPLTTCYKEVIDNLIDQIRDKKCTNGIIYMDKHSITAIDTGIGISTRKNADGITHLFLAVGKLFTSSNYDGNSNLTGTHGLGISVVNFMSSKFYAGYVKNNTFTGYVFEEGIHHADGKELDIIQNFDSPLSDCFYVFAEYKNGILKDEVNFDWLIDYIKRRVGELPEGSKVEVFTSEHIVFDKLPGSPNYVKSWLEQVQEVEDAYTVRKNEWVYALGKNKNCFEHIKSIVRGAPVGCSKTFTAYFDIEGENIGVSVPYTMFYNGKKDIRYTDQTKSYVTMYSSNLSSILNKCPELYRHFKQEAEQIYVLRNLKKTGTEAYWPALGTKKELIIAEGHSAASGIKGERNPKTQAIFALRGKILNAYGKPLKVAMRSPVIKELLTIISSEKFDKIIIATDSDSHGIGHIAVLLVGTLVSFAPHLIKEEKVFLCETPLYIFTKSGEMRYSNNPNDCPHGWLLKSNKGLASLTPKQTKYFITNESTRTLLRIEKDEDADKMLHHALVEGGKRWIHEYSKLDLNLNMEEA